MKLFHRFWYWLTKPAALVDWLGHGAKPVPKSVAMSRAEICLSCPLNQRGNTFVEHAAWRIKTKLGLSVSKEKYLHSCSGCSCFLPLKIWVPYSHIRQWLPDATVERMKEANGKCWQV